jgi:hypothetical protein
MSKFQFLSRAGRLPDLFFKGESSGGLNTLQEGNRSRKFEVGAEALDMV